MYTEEDMKLFWTAYQEMFYPECEMHPEYDENDNDYMKSLHDVDFYNL